MPDNSYRSEFDSPEKAEKYDTEQYGSSSWSSLLWSLEQEVLARTLGQMYDLRHERYLDFACGTGRVIKFLAPQFKYSVGVDISTAMLERARTTSDAIDVRCGDVTSDPALAGSDFDLITAFRFVLNADDEDRLAVMKWMRSVVRDANSRVIINNHSHFASHKAIPHMARRLSRQSTGVTGKVLSHRHLRDLISEAGFEIERRVGLGIGGGKTLSMVSSKRALHFQRRFVESTWLGRLGEDQIYVLSPA